MLILECLYLGLAEINLFQKRNQVLILCLFDLFPPKPVEAVLRVEAGECVTHGASRLGGVAQQDFQLEVNTRRQGCQGSALGKSNPGLGAVTLCPPL